MSIESHEKGRKKMSIGGSVPGPAQNLEGRRYPGPVFIRIYNPLQLLVRVIRVRGVCLVRVLGSFVRWGRHDRWKLSYWATIYTRDEQDANPNRRHF